MAFAIANATPFESALEEVATLTQRLKVALEAVSKELPRPPVAIVLGAELLTAHALVARAAEVEREQDGVDVNAERTAARDAEAKWDVCLEQVGGLMGAVGKVLAPAIVAARAALLQTPTGTCDIARPPPYRPSPPPPSVYLRRDR